MGTFTIFYSWQTDLPDETNRRLIREALREASSRLEEEFLDSGLHVVLDEATRDTPGSPNIPFTILEKVRNAEVFLADITTINSAAPRELRRVPNPNVMFELGYAVAHLGWNRIVMFFNKAHGNLDDDVPFDIDRHRVTPYHFSVPTPQEGKLTKKEIAQRKEPLIGVLAEALRIIVTRNPARPDDDLTSDQKKRRDDVRALEALLSTIHIPTLEAHIQEAPHFIYNRIFFFWERFTATVSSHLFHIYDEKLRAFVQDVHQSWGETLSYDKYYIPTSGSRCIFHTPGDVFRERDEEDAWHQAEISIHRLNEALAELLRYVRTDYLEVDPRETSTRAWNSRVDYLTKANLLDSL